MLKFYKVGGLYPVESKLEVKMLMAAVKTRSQASSWSGVRFKASRKIPITTSCKFYFFKLFNYEKSEKLPKIELFGFFWRCVVGQLCLGLLEASPARLADQQSC